MLNFIYCLILFIVQFYLVSFFICNFILFSVQF